MKGAQQVFHFIIITIHHAIKMNQFQSNSLYGDIGTYENIIFVGDDRVHDIYIHIYFLQCTEYDTIGR